MTKKSRLLANIAAYIASGALIVGALAFLYTVAAPVDVLKNWKLTTDKTAYNAGDTIIATSSFVKLRSVNGTSHRYLDCLTKTGSTNRMDVSEAVANRPSGVGGSISIPIQLPYNVPNLPARCKISIVVDYQVYSYRDFSEYTSSNYFTVNPRPAGTTSTSNTVVQPTNYTTNPAGTSSSTTTNNTSTTTTTTTNPTEVTTPMQQVNNPPTGPAPNPGILPSIVNALGNGIQNVINALP